MLGHDKVVVVKGRVNQRDDTVSIYASDLTLPDITDGPRGPVVVTTETTRATAGKIEQLKTVLSSHPGSTEVHVRLSQPGRSLLMKLDDSYRVNATEALFGDLKVILGSRRFLRLGRAARFAAAQRSVAALLGHCDARCSGAPTGFLPRTASRHMAGAAPAVRPRRRGAAYQENR